MSFAKLICIIFLGINLSASAEPPDRYTFAFEIEILKPESFLEIEKMINIPILCQKIIQLQSLDIFRDNKLFKSKKHCKNTYSKKGVLAEDLRTQKLNGYLQSNVELENETINRIKFTEVLKDEHKKKYSHLSWHYDQDALEFKYIKYTTNKEEYFNFLKDFSELVKIDKNIYYPMGGNKKIGNFHGNYSSTRWTNMENPDFNQLYNIFTSLRKEYLLQNDKTPEHPNGRTYFNTQTKNSYNSSVTDKGVIKIKDALGHFIETRTHTFDPLKEWEDLDKYFSGDIKEVSKEMADEIYRILSDKDFLKKLFSKSFKNQSVMDLINDIAKNPFIDQYYPSLKRNMFIAFKEYLTPFRYSKLVLNGIQPRDILRKYLYFNKMRNHIEDTAQSAYKRRGFRKKYQERVLETIDGLKESGGVWFEEAGKLLNQPQILRDLDLMDPLVENYIEQIDSHESLNLVWTNLRKYINGKPVMSPDDLKDNKLLAKKVQEQLRKHKKLSQDLSLKYQSILKTFLNNYELYDEYFSEFDFPLQQSDYLFQFKESGIVVSSDAKRSMPQDIISLLKKIDETPSDAPLLLTDKEEWYLKYIINNYDEKVLLALLDNSEKNSFAYNILKEIILEKPQKIQKYLPKNKNGYGVFRLDNNQKLLFKQFLQDPELKPIFMEQILQEIAINPRNTNLYFSQIEGLRNELKIIRELLTPVIEPPPPKEKKIERAKAILAIEDNLGQSLQLDYNISEKELSHLKTTLKLELCLGH